MKKRIMIIAVLVLAIAAPILFFRNNGGDVSKVSKLFVTSGHYSEEDIYEAMDVVVEYFSNNFEGCTLIDLRYDESISVAAGKEWAEIYKAEEAIVLLSSFDVDASGGDGSLNPNTTYDNWQWILVRDVGELWRLETWGY